eukprot:SAG31_NODE_27637_length_422_cov_2.727554_1_plen_55_part_01
MLLAHARRNVIQAGGSRHRVGVRRTVCKMIGFQGFWRFKAIYFSIGAFFVNIPWG